MRFDKYQKGLIADKTMEFWDLVNEVKFKDLHISRILAFDINIELKLKALYQVRAHIIIDTKLDTDMRSVKEFRDINWWIKEAKVYG